MAEVLLRTESGRTLAYDPAEPGRAVEVIHGVSGRLYVTRPDAPTKAQLDAERGHGERDAEAAATSDDAYARFAAATGFEPRLPERGEPVSEGEAMYDRHARATGVRR